ncbi:MAG: nucleotidyl transferase AbiEii/AbiGii toxin family protein [Chloroflexota bacterium]
MLNAGVLTFKEFALREPLPLATIHDAVLDFLRGRDDVVVEDALAVNAYVGESRMTQDVDLLSTRATELAEELRTHLNDRFHIAVRVREIGAGRGHRLYQTQQTGNRHWVDVRPVAQLPPAQRIERVLVVAPAELIAYKVISYHQRRGQPKSGTDWRDLAMLLLTFPELKRESGIVRERLQAADADEAVMNVWKELVAQEISATDEDAEF